MRLSIRNQILIPIVGIQALALTAITMTTATLAARRSEREIIGRLNGVIDTLEHANFPYTASVLSKIRGLSGAHFVALTADGRVAETTLPAVGPLPSQVRRVPPIDRIESLSESPTIEVDQTRYFAVPLRPSGEPRDSSILILYPETSWRQARWEAATPPLAVGLGTLGVLGAVTVWIAHRISGRIRTIQEQVARIASGDFEPSDPGRRSDEVQDLARSINRMGDQLNQMQQTIRQSERTRLLAQLAAGLAHQLRNSLTGARISVQLHARRFPPPAGDETLNVALRQLAMTEEQVKGLLSLGRADPRTRSPCDPCELLETIALLVDPACQHARVDFRRDWNALGPCLLADEPGLRGAVLNLVMNAIEAAGPGGRVRLRASIVEDEVTIEVSDNGPGPPPGVSETLMDAFFTTKPEGVGLGLSIARQVATDHGGRLSWCRCEGETRFQMTLPRWIAGPREVG